MRSRSNSILLLTLLLMACNSGSMRNSPLSEFSLLAPASLGTDVGAFQQWDIHRHDNTVQTLQLALEIRGNSLELVAIDPLGRRLGSLSYEGDAYRLEMQPGVELAVDLRQLLAVLQTALWPLEALNENNGAQGWHFVQQLNQREAWYHGENVARITRRESAPWSGRYHYRNHAGDEFSLQSSRLP